MTTHKEIEQIKKLIGNFLCKIGWHSVNWNVTKHDGYNIHAKCKRCGYEGLVDSQGNLF